MLKRILLGVTLLSYCVLLSAQEASDQDKDKLYITDQLRLSLYTSANSQSKVVKLLQSGDLLEVEELSGAYAFVTAPGGVKGWVKRGFLVDKPTHNLLLRDEQQKTLELTAEIEKLANSKAVIDQYEQDMDKLVVKIDELETEKQKVNESNAELQQLVEAKQREIDRRDDDSAPAMLVLWDTFRSYWQWITPMIALIILLSFLVSKVIIESRIKSKFHGIKIW
ncbi:MAG: TIGR04211 family SH3 domain-containing protein [Gammaproteobacteria bacterium]